LVVDFGEGFAGSSPGVFAALEDLIDGVVEFGGVDWGCGLGGGGGGAEGGESEEVAERRSDLSWTSRSAPLRRELP